MDKQKPDIECRECNGLGWVIAYTQPGTYVLEYVPCKQCNSNGQRKDEASVA
jgi:DnaJ-class molecular chaperone